MTETIDCPRCAGECEEILSLKPPRTQVCGGCNGTKRMEVPAGVVVTFELEEREQEAAA